ncbi:MULTISPECIES: nucleotidyltransferase family protein [unclassified Crossiella]|uniref:nucleotidyltransferase family protein n=1 Tax=unclassified Crossiella TaxID=2620835 RepID=UPI001FFEB8FB|nr:MULTISPECIES: nucleotidyltransferase family protein [unclassified Crossiella]MCK2238587.1 nucleotidyltransferase family protein [Crossiella sp. S99.2]MCK2251843.1 nucleotidyltransferase family protein [Crossiella sp. S99.1]
MSAELPPLPLEDPPDQPPTADPEALLRTLVKVVTTLRAKDIPFAVTGGAAAYARGGAASDHDIDLLVTAEDARRAVQALMDNGMRGAQPPEDWLLKAYDGDRLIDLIFRPNDRPVTREQLATAEDLRVGSVNAPVARATDLVIDKLLVLGPHRCDFTELLPMTRALREQVDWERVATDTAGSPYAEAFLLLAKRLRIAPALGALGHRGGQGERSQHTAV